MIMTTKEISEKFNIKYNAVVTIFNAKGSPAFKKGFKKKSPWCCDDEEFKTFLQKKSEIFKAR